MRFKSAVSALGIAMALVIGLDYVAFAATGGSFLLGKSNSASTTTSLSRTTNGPTLVLNSKAGQPPLKVNRPVKAVNLNADRLDGFHASAFARPTRVTAFTPPGCQVLASVTSSFKKIADLGTFNKAASNTLAEIEFSTVLWISSTTANGTVFELRVDNAPTTRGRATTLLRADGSGTEMPAQVQGIFPGLSAGNHTVSLWAKVTNNTTGTNAMYDPGCFNSAGANNVYVSEYR